MNVTILLLGFALSAHEPAWRLASVERDVWVGPVSTADYIAAYPGPYSWREEVIACRFVTIIEDGRWVEDYRIGGCHFRINRSRPQPGEKR